MLILVSGFNESSVEIPLDDMVVEQMGPLPANVDDDDATVALCCRQDGDAHSAIYLPTPQPFALLKVIL